MLNRALFHVPHFGLFFANKDHLLYAHSEGNTNLNVTSIDVSTLKTVIGLEVHAQVLTKSKMYCSCSADYANAEPNTHVCMVCLGLPGALPVMNEQAIQTVIRTGLALNCEIPEFCKMDRKNYVYPDLPKGYQISQYDLPLCIDGTLEITVDGETRTAGITRVHIEEDTGRLVHDIAANEGLSLVDLNRSGVPLMEIVGEPDLTTPEEAREYLIALRRILRAIGASTGNMEEGAFRCDANISVRAEDGSFIGPKVEIKNMNSFRAVERALKYEEVRQREAVVNGEELVQETRGWVDGQGITVSQRSKEAAHDYRYFPEPDLPPLHISREMVAQISTTVGELPVDRERRFVSTLGVSVADAAVLNSERGIADYFEAAVGENTSNGYPQQIANWLLNDVMGMAKARGMAADEFPITSDQLRELVDLVVGKKLTGTAAKSVLAGLNDGEAPTTAAERLNLLAMEDDGAVLAAAREAMEAQPAAVADYRSGKQAAIGRLMGETMKRTGGRASADDVRAALLSLLNEA
ncbi:MAG: Asp-tRNA(Asn)/Glu-tRNA(Gln) amidotransferase subunit GatB [Thermomicrobiales bacterium]|nr:Asp-tRNA(Asn)/Glu-tRNA(Gln) amidotransferase subunit GatB [Thermomicrobiales bacterium]